MNDLISDALTRIRNASMRRLDTTKLLHSNVVEGVLKVLEAKGYVESFNVVEEERKKFIAEKEAEYQEKFASPYQAASRGYIDDVIEPRNTRFRVIRAFKTLQTKRLTNPLKKYSNIPL